MNIRTRFAPSPTGYLHLGNIWVAFLNWLWTRQHKGEIVLRIEDIDETRCHKNYISFIKNDLEWLGIDWDEEPGTCYFYGEPLQSKRIPIYEEIKQRWQHSGEIYPCFCSRTRLHQISSAPHKGETITYYDGHCRYLSQEEQKALTKKPSWRLKVENTSIEFNDLFHHLQSKNLEREKDDFAIFRADGAVAYQLATPTDDGAMKITHVFRGSDLLPSTFYQIYILKKLNYTVPVYGHLPLLVDKDGIRLSKRQKGLTIQELKQNHISPEQIIGQLLYWAGAISHLEPISAQKACNEISFNECKNLNHMTISI